MGVQQHGDDATEIKARTHKKRCEKSTSSSLGVRLCGMQVGMFSNAVFLIIKEMLHHQQKMRKTRLKKPINDMGSRRKTCEIRKRVK